MNGKVSGSCLCGAVRFLIDGKYGPVGQCHCSKCRKVSGTDGNAVFHAAADAFTWTSGEDKIARYEVPDGGGWASRFCRVCGSPVPGQPPGGRIWFVPAGLLDDDPGFRGYAGHIHVASKAPWVEITDGRPCFEAGYEPPVV